MRTKKFLSTLLIFFLAGLAYGDFKNIDKQFIRPVNLLLNPGFEQGISNWTASGGSFTLNTTASNVGAGAASGAFDASASSQTLTSKAVAIPAGLYGRNGLAQCNFKTAATDYKIQAYDGSNVLAETTITTNSTFVPTGVNFVFPTSGNIQLRIISQSNAAVVYVDECFVGDASNLTQVSQAQFFGEVLWPQSTNCAWQITQTTYAADFSADSDCTFPSGGGIRGNASAPGTKIPAIVFSSMPAGDYLFIARGAFHLGTSSQAASFRFYDGTTGSDEQSEFISSTAPLQVPVIVGRFTYTTAQSNVTIRIQGRATSGDATIDAATGSGLTISVWYFPSSTQTAVSPDQVGWRISANIAGSNPSLGTSAQSSYTGIEDGSLTMTQNSGSAAVQIPCSGTNPPTGLTCAAGNESVGVSFTPPMAGDYYACATFGHEISNAGSGSVNATFQIVETPTNAQTISAEGNERLPSAGRISTAVNQNPVKVCGIFTFAANTQRVLRLFYEQTVNPTISSNIITADADTSLGQRDIHWDVFPLRPWINAPLIVGSVTSNSLGIERIERATVNCTSSSTIVSQSGSWISSISNISSGVCTLTVPVGIFSGTPSCVATVETGTSFAVGMGGLSSTSIPFRIFNTTSNANSTADQIHIHCMGPR